MQVAHLTLSEKEREILSDLSKSVQVVQRDNDHTIEYANGDLTPEVVCRVPSAGDINLGDPSFCRDYGVVRNYMTGAMANGIASEDLVIAMGQQKMLASFGAAGLLPDRLEAAILKIKAALPNGPFAFNLIHSPNEDLLEREGVNLYLKHGVKVVEASAFLGLTKHIVRYRLAGLSKGSNGEIEIGNRVIAKISRREVATRFMEPAPEKMVQELLAEGLISAEQAEMSKGISMADDIIVEADSGGHTDNRPLVCLLPSMIALRDELQRKFNYPYTIRVGAAGGISTPASAYGAFSMGAAFVVTGSVNESCIESGVSPMVKDLLANAGMADVMMAPAADMFEMGVQLQVLKKGTLFPMKAKKLYELYKTYDRMEDIPVDERQKIEKSTFQATLDDIWEETKRFFNERDPEQIQRAEGNPKRKMALVFRWYLGLSSRWANVGEESRKMDYQIWCGPSMGAFNDWSKGTYLDEPSNRKVADVAMNIMNGTAYLARIQMLNLNGIEVDHALKNYIPKPAL